MKFYKIILPVALALVGFAFASKADASQLQNLKVTLGDSRPSVNSTFAFSFTHPSANTIKEISFQFCKEASGACTETGVNLGALSLTGSTGLGTNTWTNTVAGKLIRMAVGNTDGGAGLTAGATITVTFGGITNNALSEGCDTTPGTDTCFIRINTYTGFAGTGLVDDGVTTYTIVDEVTVTAKVDPTFTFVVAGVNAGTVNNQITTSVNSTPNTLPFGSLQAGTPKYAAHALYVTTNTGAGYTVDAQMVTAMTGVNTSNNIDPFIAPWTAATTWTEPTGGVPNADTGWIGGNTTDQDITGWTAGDTPALKFGGISDSAVTVSKKSSSDNGLTPVYVTYAVEANVFQPSDFYTGKLIYNALPTY